VQSRQRNESSFGCGWTAAFTARIPRTRSVRFSSALAQSAQRLSARGLRTACPAVRWMKSDCERARVAASRLGHVLNHCLGDEEVAATGVILRLDSFGSLMVDTASTESSSGFGSDDGGSLAGNVPARVSSRAFSRMRRSSSWPCECVIVVLSLAVMATVAARHQLSAPPDLSGVDVDYRRAPRTVASAAEAGPLSFHIRRPAIAQFDRALGECDIL
jgi:hypothetical protein